jgi:hypothetical protein
VSLVETIPYRVSMFLKLKVAAFPVKLDLIALTVRTKEGRRKEIRAKKRINEKKGKKYILQDYCLLGFHSM